MVRPKRTPALLVAVAAVAAGCSLVKTKEEASAIVAGRVVGMRAGDFFDFFGRAQGKTEALDGSAVYRWESSVGAMPPGVQSLDDRVCKLVVTVDKGGRVTAAEVVRDTVGRTSASRCGEIFQAR